MTQTQPEDAQSKSTIENTLSLDEIAACKQHRQGDLLQLDALPMLGLGGTQEHTLPLGAALISQTCDVVLPNRPNVVVAAVAQLNRQDSREARAGKRPRYVHLPAAGDDTFADLEYIG